MPFRGGSANVKAHPAVAITRRSPEKLGTILSHSASAMFPELLQLDLGYEQPALVSVP